MSNNLPTTIQDNIKERIKLIVGELIPEEVYNEIVTKTTEDFLKNDLPKMVKEELAGMYREKIKEEVYKPEWQTRYNQYGPMMSDKIKEIIVECAPMMLANMMGYAAQQVVMNYQQQTSQYRGY